MENVSGAGLPGEMRGRAGVQCKRPLGRIFAFLQELLNQYICAQVSGGKPHHDRPVVYVIVQHILKICSCRDILGLVIQEDWEREFQRDSPQAREKGTGTQLPVKSVKLSYSTDPKDHLCRQTASQKRCRTSAYWRIW